MGGGGLELLVGGARVLIPIFSPPPSGFFLQGSEGASSYTPYGSIGLTLVLSGSTPGVLGDQPKILGPRTCCGVQLLFYLLQTSRCTRTGWRCFVLSLLLGLHSLYIASTFPRRLKTL